MWHQDLADGKWQRLTLMEQLGNIGSEVGRALHAREQGEEARAQSALYRALELFDLTLADARHRDSRRRELARAREVTVDSLSDHPQYGGPAGLEDYFMYFALAARKDR